MCTLCAVRRRLLLLTLLVVFAFAVARRPACGAPRARAAAAGSDPPLPRRSRRRSACTPASLPTAHQGRADRRHRLAGLSAVLREQQADQRQGLRERGGLRDRRQARLQPAAQVKWTVEPFDSSYAPGPEVVRLRHQRDLDHPGARPGGRLLDSVLHQPAGRSSSPPRRRCAHATSLAALQGRQDRRADRDARSLDAVNSQIKPSSQPQVFNTSNDVVSAFKIHRVNAIVVDLATAFELTATALPHTTIAGQFSAPGGDNWGVLLSKGSKLTPCVDQAVTALRADGTLAALSQRWIASAASAPVLH